MTKSLIWILLLFIKSTPSLASDITDDQMDQYSTGLKKYVHPLTGLYSEFICFNSSDENFLIAVSEKNQILVGVGNLFDQKFFYEKNNIRGWMLFKSEDNEIKWLNLSFDEEAPVLNVAIHNFLGLRKTAVSLKTCYSL